jgi:hypothetical protein
MNSNPGKAPPKSNHSRKQPKQKRTKQKISFQPKP